MPRLSGGVAICLLIATTAGAQNPVPGQNINMVSGTTLPYGDPYLQKQNEPSVAVSTRNPCHLLAGANDYRTVNIPGVPDDKEYGDAWVGFYKSNDCGQTWFSTLIPGYPQDTSTTGTASPVKGLTTAADPTVRAGTSGLFFYSFIAFNRGTNVGKLAVARAVDNNNKEVGDAIKYIDTTIWDSGSAGQFIDKPYLAVTPNTGTCTINGQTYPGNTVHLIWTVFVGNDINIRTKLYYAKSSNCGVTLDAPPTKLSESYAINQGASLAISPNGNNVFAVWRQFPDNTDPSQILTAYSIDGGKTFSKAAILQAFSPLASFDQGTTATTFRTNAFPSAATDQTGRVYVALSVRGYASGNQARIALTSSTDGVSWTMPVAIANDSAAADASHQIMPALTFAGGKLHAVWYDLRDDMVRKAGYGFTDYIDEVWPTRHTLDVRGAQGTPQGGGVVAWNFYDVLQFAPEKTVPRVSRYAIGYYVTSSGATLHQLQFNRPNLKLYAGGTRPFMGDFIDVAGLNYVPTGTAPQQWVLNTGPAGGFNTTAAQTVNAVWTDNRDVRAPGGSADLGYAAPGTAACTASTASLTGTRNANVYTSRITPALVVTAPGNAKSTVNALGGIQRAFAVMVQNRTETLRRFQLTIANQPTGGTASWGQFAQILDIFADIPGRSSAARTVFVSSPNRYSRITVNVQEVVTSGTPLTGSTILNPDIQNPDIQNPDIQNPDIQNPDIQNPDIQNNEIHNPDIQNPDIQNPDIQNPDIQNPDIQNPDIQNPDVQNPDIQNPDVQNPDIQNPDIQNPDIQNPDIQNPDIQNGSITDVNFDVSNKGNTTSAYQVKFSVTGDTTPFLFQAIGRRVYKTPTSNGCTLALQGQNQTLFNVNNPDLSPTGLPDPNAGDKTNMTVLLRPGETIRVTLRAWDKDVLRTSVPGQDGVKTTPFCPMLSATCSTITNIVTGIVTAQAANVVNGVVTTTPVLTQTYTAPAMVITTASLPPGVVDSGTGAPTYTQQLQATGGNPAAYAWSISSGALPPGLSLSPAGLISGTPTTPGTYNFTARLTDGIQTTSAAYTVTLVQYYYNMAFTTQPPTTTFANQSFPITVEVRDAAGAVIPNAQVQLALLDNTTNGTLTPAVPTASTNAVGVASFTVSVDRPGTYTIVAMSPSLAAPTIGRSSTTFTVAPVYTVVNVHDSGPGSLRQAITDATNTKGGKITFNIPGTGAQTIAVQSTLPSILYPMVIDGTSQPGYSGTPVIALNGAAVPLGRGFNGGLTVQATNSTIRGLAIYGFAYVPGIVVAGNGNVIQSNYVGTDTTGTAGGIGNSAGIEIAQGANNLIGGDFFGQGNVIAGNVGAGVAITGANTAGNLVRGNIIGVNPGGTLGVANRAQGVLLTNGAISNVIGGRQDNGTAPNEIRGNTGAGIAVTGATTLQNVLRQNNIDGNGGPGIDLGDDGVTQNDAGDADTGPNGLQNWPVMDHASFTNGFLQLGSSLNSTPSTPFSIDFYYSPGCDGARPQGRQGGFGLLPVTDANGNTSSDVGYGLNSPLLAGYYTAIATRAQNASGWVNNTFYDTSEFSNCVPVSVGGNGGSAFAQIACPAGSVATGFQGRSGDDIDRTELWCSPVSGTTVGTSTFVGGVGSTTSATPYNLSCAAGGVITGIFGYAGTATLGGNVVDTLGVTCTDVVSNATTNVGPTGVQSSTASPFNLSCPAGTRVVAIEGREGVVLDRLAIICK